MVITHSLQEASDKNIYVLTQERVIEEDFVGDVDFFVIDEFYKLSTWADSGNRCALLNEAFYRLYKKCEHFYMRSEEHTSELQSRGHLVCRLLLEKKKKNSRILK